jgi:signal transduction histidine kinase
MQHTGHESDTPLLAATAHELRQPLSHIKAFVSSLQRRDVDWDTKTESEFLEEIELETDRLAEIIDTLLTARSKEVSSARS